MKAMIVILAFVVICGFACDYDNDSVIFNYNTDEVFRHGIVYSPNDLSFQLTVEEINDSRCPEGVVCIWQGEVSVTLGIYPSGKEKLILKSVHQPVDTLGNHKFTLLEVTPYPKYKQPLVLSDYQVKIRVENLQ